MKLINKRGFTIVEILIAMAVFSSMALLASMVVLQIGKTYYKGVTSINVQDITRTTVAAISEQVQFSGGQVTAETAVRDEGAYGGYTPERRNQFKSFCSGSNRYTYATDRILKPSTSNPGLLELNAGTAFREHSLPHVLWHDQRPDPNGTCDPVNLADGTLSGGRELLGENMRIVNFNINRPDPVNNPNLVNIELDVIYGENDLILRNPPNTGTIQGCKGSIVGAQWCARSSLKTYVYRRLTQ